MSDALPTAAFVGLGSNLGDPVARIRDAFAALAALPQTTLHARSSLFRSAPIGYENQGDFVNAVCWIDTHLSPAALLGHLQHIEHAAGRRRAGHRYGPRPLDLDLLLFGDLTLDEASLQLPHPRLHERRFALEPLAELCPELVIPGRGKVAELLRVCAEQRVERMSELSDSG